MKTYKILLAILCLYLLSACNYRSLILPKIGDDGLLSGEPCSAPCFWNITPGTTSEKEALGEVTSRLGIFPCHRWDSSNSGGTKGILCSDISISFDDQNTVSVIGFNPTQEITVSNVISKYGEPDGVFITFFGIGSQPPVAALLYFDSLGMIVHLPEQNNKSYNLQAEIPVERIVYLKKSDYFNNKSLVQSWKGYGIYKSLPK